MREHLRTWNDSDGHGFRVRLYTNWQKMEPCHDEVLYEFYHCGVLIFEGAIGVPGGQTIDGDSTILTVLKFCSMQPGDTDPEYFRDYTDAQMEWCETWGETLGGCPGRRGLVRSTRR